MSSSALLSSSNQSVHSHYDNRSVTSAASSMALYSLRSLRCLFLSETSTPLSQADWERKRDEILDCITGENEEISLWELRELGLSKGGFLSSDIRKRAWPKLLQCSTLSNKLESSESLDAVNLQLLQHNVGQTIWNMEEHLLAARQERQREQEVVDQQLAQLHRRVSFKEPLERARSPPAILRKQPPSTPPATIDTMVADDTPRDDTSLLSNDDGLSSVLDDDDLSVHTHETSFTLSSRVVRWRKASPQEQKILYNVISSVLQQRPENHPAFVDDRYYHYPGLQDLCALLVINLESPSLTSLVLGKLARYHLRDVMRPSQTVLDSALETALPLLEYVDPGLYSYMYQSGLTLPNFCRNWIACWFAQDVPYAPMASRLLDAFLVGHASLPVYVAVAFLTTQREYVLASQTEISNLSLLYTTVRGLPFHSLTQGLDFNDADDIAIGMERIETVLQKSLEYMGRLPPDALMEVTLNRQEKMTLTNIVMFDAPPTFLTDDTAPTDYADLQVAKMARLEVSSPRNRYSIPGEDEVEKEVPGLLQSASLESSPEQTTAKIVYPLARAALGMGTKTPRRVQSRRILFLLVVLAIVAAFCWPQGTTSTAPRVLWLPGRVRKTRRFLLPGVAKHSNSTSAEFTLTVYQTNIWELLVGQHLRFWKQLWVNFRRSFRRQRA